MKFWTNTDRQIDSNRAIIKSYYESNKEFFEDIKLPWGHPHLTSGAIPVADLVYSGNKQELLDELKTHQHVGSVVLI